MHIVFAWLFYAFLFLTIIACAISTTRYYNHPVDAHWLSTLTTTINLALLSICIFIVPVDIYNISAVVDPVANQAWMNLCYYSLYAGLLFSAFVLTPYAYFYVDTDLEEVRGKRMTSACKYTVAFILMLCALLVVGLIFRPGRKVEQADGMAWLKSVLDTEHNGTQAMHFVIACLALAGIGPWLVYVGSGLAALPISLIKSGDTLRTESSVLETEQHSLLEKEKQIDAKYMLTGRQMSKKDRERRKQLDQDSRLLAARLGRLNNLQQSAINRALVKLSPFSKPAGIVCAVMSVLLCSSWLLGCIDRLLHSTCSWRCGYALSTGQASVPNPVDLLLLLSSHLFPLDYIVLALVVVYTFIVAISGIVAIDVRVLCVSVYKIQRANTAPKALLLMSVYLMFIQLVLMMQVITLAPQYITYGTQTYEGEPCHLKPASVNSTVLLSVQPSELGQLLELPIDESTCHRSRISVLIARSTTVLPVFGVVEFVTNWLTALTFAVSAIFLAVKKTPRYMRGYFIEDDI